MGAVEPEWGAPPHCRPGGAVGSVGKAHVCTRSFYPRSDSLRYRWQQAFANAHGLRGYEPIELYEAKGRYYVIDGHFRPSVAQALGNDTIQARVHRWVLSHACRHQSDSSSRRGRPPRDPTQRPSSKTSRAGRSGAL